MTNPEAEAIPALNVDAALVQGLFVGSGSPPTAISSPAPFEDATQVTLTKPINTDQLGDELSAALSRTVLLALTDYDETADISDTNVAKLWISPSGLDESVIETVVSNHSPYAAYNVPKADQDYSAAVQRIMNDNQVQLTSDEMQVLLRGLVLRIERGTTTSVTPSFPSGAPTT
jgi:hypothetical protein